MFHVYPTVCVSATRTSNFIVQRRTEQSTTVHGGPVRSAPVGAVTHVSFSGDAITISSSRPGLEGARAQRARASHGGGATPTRGARRAGPRPPRRGPGRGVRVLTSSADVLPTGFTGRSQALVPSMSVSNPYMCMCWQAGRGSLTLRWWPACS